MTTPDVTTSRGLEHSLRQAQAHMQSAASKGVADPTDLVGVGNTLKAAHGWLCRARQAAPTNHVALRRMIEIAKGCDGLEWAEAKWAKGEWVCKAQPMDRAWQMHICKVFGVPWFYIRQAIQIIPEATAETPRAVHAGKNETLLRATTSALLCQHAGEAGIAIVSEYWRPPEQRLQDETFSIPDGASVPTKAQRLMTMGARKLWAGKPDKAALHFEAAASMHMGLPILSPSSPQSD